MEKIQPKKRQKGAALVLVMSLLAGGLIVGVSGMNTSYIDQRLSGNYKATSEALLKAEGVASTAYLNVIENGDEEWSGANDESFDNLESIGLNGNDWSELMSDASLCDEDELYVPVMVDGADYYIISFGIVCGDQGVVAIERIFNEYKFSSSEDDIFGIFGDYALLSDGEMNVSGSSVVDGRVHSNTSVNAAFTQQNADLLELGDSGITSEKSVDIPSLSLDDVSGNFSEIVDLPLQIGKGKKSDYCELDSSDLENGGDLGNKIYSCSGELDISGNFTNGAIYAEGDIVHSGAVTIGDFHDSEKSVSVFSLGDIRFNGSTAIWGGFFYAEGDVRQNGSSVIYGSVIAKGEIDFNGSTDIKYRALPSSWGEGEKDDESSEVELSSWRN